MIGQSVSFIKRIGEKPVIVWRCGCGYTNTGHIHYCTDCQFKELARQAAQEQEGKQNDQVG